MTESELWWWWYMSSPERGLAHVAPDDRRRTMLRSVLVVVVYLLAVPIAYALPAGAVGLAPLAWLVLAVVDPITGWLYARLRRRAAAG